jgi:hypothetical protein
MPDRRSFFWTDAEDARLRLFAEQGVHARNIAIRLKRPTSGVKRRAKLLGFPLRSAPRASLPARW